MQQKPHLPSLILCTAIPLAAGGLSAALTSGSMEAFGQLRQPPLSPPGWVFPVAWTVLYTLMGVASYVVLRAPVSQRERSSALQLYALQLVMNFLWPLLFFRFELYGFSFFWLLGLLAAVCLTCVRFRRISPAAGRLLYPYVAWLCFAAYLNAGVALLQM